MYNDMPPNISISITITYWWIFHKQRAPHCFRGKGKRKRSVTPLSLPQMFCQNVTWTSYLDQRRSKRPWPTPLPRPPRTVDRTVRICVPPPGKEFRYAARGYAYLMQKAADAAKAASTVDASIGEYMTASLTLTLTPMLDDSRDRRLWPWWCCGIY